MHLLPHILQDKVLKSFWEQHFPEVWLRGNRTISEQKLRQSRAGCSVEPLQRMHGRKWEHSPVPPIPLAEDGTVKLTNFLRVWICTRDKWRAGGGFAFPRVWIFDQRKTVTKTQIRSQALMEKRLYAGLQCIAECPIKPLVCHQARRFMSNFHHESRTKTTKIAHQDSPQNKKPYRCPPDSWNDVCPRCCCCCCYVPRPPHCIIPCGLPTSSVHKMG